MPNDVSTPRQILAAVAALITPGTRVASTQVFVDTSQSLYLQTTTWPLVTLAEGPQSVARIYYRLWQVKLTAFLTYYDRWDQQPQSLDTIWANIDSDLRIMKANLENAPTLSGTADSLVHFALSTYTGGAVGKGETLAIADAPLPVPLVYRQATLLINCLPYLSSQ